MVFLYSGVFDPRCPSLNGRTCNFRGSCGDFGICACMPQFSGDSCETSLCPDYDPNSGTVCGGKGLCSPLMDIEDIPEACKQYTPSESNRFSRSGPGWSGEACAELVRIAQGKIETGLFSNAEARGIPMCLCHPPYGGRGCQLNQCPLGPDLSVCSSNGNKSVGLVRNNTATGDGCQCLNYVSLVDILLVLPRDSLVKVHDMYLHDFKIGFCGIPRMIGGELLLLQSQFPLVDTKCYCDEKHYGQACQNGVCPEFEGVHCAGNGHGDLGFGVERKISVKRRNDCTPVCSPGKVYCSGRCALPSSCVSAYARCPVDKPYRCANNKCVDGEKMRCSRAYESGTWDDLSTVPRRIKCTFEELKSIANLEVRARQQALCFGLASQISIAGVMPTSGIQFGSLLLGIEIRIVGSGVVSVEYGTHFSAELSAPGFFVLDTHITASQSANMRFTAGKSRVLERGEASEEVWVYSVIEAQTTWLKAISASGIVTVGAAGYRGIDFGFEGDWGLALMSSGLYFGTKGEAVSENSCAENPALCAWSISDRESLEGLRVCLGVSPAEFDVAISCPENQAAVELIKVRPYVKMRVAASIWSDWPDSGVYLVSEKYSGDSPLPALSFAASDENTAIVSVEYILLADIIKPCICFPVAANISVLDTQYYNSLTRPVVDRVGDYAVALVLVDGEAVPTRGKMVSLYPGVLQLKLSAVPAIGLSRRLSSYEFGYGAFDCDSSAFPARCSDGSCSRINAFEVANITETCDCTMNSSGTFCMCRDEFGEERTTDSPHVLPNLAEMCIWAAMKSPPTFNRAFGAIGESTHVLEASLPLWIEFAGCDPQFEWLDTPHEIEPCSIRNRTRVRGVFDFTEMRDSYVVISNRTFISEIYADMGGISLFSIDFDVVTAASSGNVSAVRRTDFAYWESDVSDHESSLVHTFSRASHVVSVYAEFVTVGVLSPNFTEAFVVSVLLQVSYVRDPTPDEWVTVNKVRNSVVNGSLPLTLSAEAEDRAVWAVRLFSYFQLAVRTFIPFTDQNCTSGRLIGSPPEFGSQLLKLRANPASTNETCVCEDTCVLESRNVSKDGECSDLVAFELQGWTGNISEACVSGTDCTDCGPSTRMSDNATSCATNTTRELLARFNSSGSYISGSTWSLGELMQGANTSLAWTSVIHTATRRKWMKTDCTDECMFTLCEDGSCASSPLHCPSTRYNCDGDGCVRANVQEREYSCACKVGFGGVGCTLRFCSAGDPSTGLIDPYKWCTCNGPSPLKIRPPYELSLIGRTALTNNEILDINRPSRRLGSTDVGWVRIFADKAPYGIPFLRQVVRENRTTLATNCPFRVRSSVGLHYELEECVLTRSRIPPFRVLSWKTFANNETFIWKNETHYDDSPYRCPAGHCVADERECYSKALSDPVCGGGSATCLVDGTCECPEGKMTFIITQALTDQLAVPYFHVGSATNPSRWGIPNNNGFVNAWCRARNCSAVDCTPPRGCFPGNPLLLGEDRQTTCIAPHSEGWCANDQSDCIAGIVSEPLVCSGNGELRRRDYRAEEYYCACGSYVNSVWTQNGYGGEACGDYFCQDDPSRVYYERNTQFTNLPFYDINGDRLPGKWHGPCGAAMGADPGDIAEWKACCAGIERLEACDKVPCIVAGLSQCLTVEECSGQSRKPKVYACNKRGVALADGSCACTKDTAAGTGYTFDLDVYSDKGCFRKVMCPLSTVSRSPCNTKKACGDFDSWTELPNIAYIKQQAIVMAAREGLPLTNRSIVERLFRGDLDPVILDTLDQRALGVLTTERAIATYICVYPAPDNCSAPFGMVPCVGKEQDVGPYMKSLQSPFMLRDTFLGVLTDGKWSSSNSTYVFETEGQTLNTTTRRCVYLGKQRSIDIVRVHVLLQSSSTLFFENEAGASICQPSLIPARSDYTWHSIFCLDTYVPFDFKTNYPSVYAALCSEDESSQDCEAWMQSTCLTIPSAEIRPAGSVVLYYGCDLARCCVLVSSPYTETSSVCVSSAPGGFIDEIVLFGHSSEVEPLPEGLRSQFEALGNSDPACVDEKVFFSPEFRLGGTLSAYRGNTTVARAYFSDPCEITGGVLASNVGDVEVSSGYANELGEVCYANRSLFSEGCHVNARDRSAVQNPKDLKSILQDSCMIFGCFVHDVETVMNTTIFLGDFTLLPQIRTQIQTLFCGSTMPYCLPNNPMFIRGTHLYSLSYHASTNYSLWNSTWAPNQIPWQTTIELFFQFATAHMALVASSFQIQVPPLKSYRLVCLVSCVYFGGAIISQCCFPETIGEASAANFTSLFDYAYAETVIQLDSNRYSSDLGMILNVKNAVYTKQSTCSFSFFEFPNCGKWQVDSGSGYKRGRELRLSFAPNSYELLVGVNLANLKLQCENALDCVDNTDFYIRNARSFAITGECSLWIKGASFNYTLPPNPENGGRMYYDNVLQIPDEFKPYQADIDRNGYVAEKGCYPEMYESPLVDGFVYENRLNGGPHGFGLLNGLFTDVYIVPRFSASKIHFMHGGLPYTQNIGYDNEVMGYLDSPYMCLSSKVVRTVSVVSGSIVLKRESEVLFGGEAYYSRNVTQYFQEIPGCTTTHAFSCPLDPATIPIQKCDEASGRIVIPCTQCETKRTRRFAWSQDFFNGGPLFSDEVDVVNQNSVEGGLVPAVKIFSDYSRANGTSGYRTSIDSIFESRDYKTYARLLSSFTFSQYETKFDLDYCLKVVPGTVVHYPFVFTPTLCVQMLLPVCIRDTYKFTVQSGRQCDRCGGSGRLQVLQPGETAFTRYPQASREADPFGYMLLDAYLDGTLAIDTVDRNSLPWDDIFAQIKDQQYMFAFPEVRSLLLSHISTRPGYVSRGSVADPERWVDMDFARWFPHTCPLPVKNAETGAVTKRCAVSATFCAASGFDAPFMKETLIPLVVTQPNNEENPVTVPECAFSVDPGSFSQFDEEGDAQPYNNGFLVQGYNPLVIKPAYHNATWTNTGKRVKASLDSAFTVFGTIKSSIVSGKFRLWAGTLSPFYTSPSTIEYIGDWTTLSSVTTFAVLHLPVSGHLAVIGYDFYGLHVGSSVTLSSLLVSNNATITQCQLRSFVPFVELPSSIESPSPDYTCVYSEADIRYEGDAIGECSCGPDNPLGGPACDWPSVFTDFGKKVCGGWGDDGGLEWSPSGARVPLLSAVGVYAQSTGVFGCKCRNPGLEVRTVLRPASVFDFAFYIRDDRLPNTLDYFRVEHSSATVSLAKDASSSLCGTNSAILPSWVTANEIESVLDVGVNSTWFTDLTVRDGEFLWESRNELFSRTVPHNNTVESPCLSPHSPLCRALNWNNLAFMRTSDALTDGQDSVVGYAGSFNVTLEPVADRLTVEVYSQAEEPLMVLRADGVRCLTKAEETGKTVYECPFSAIQVLRFTRTFNTMLIREVHVFEMSDSGRVAGWWA